ncbi:MAG: hypothetical protein ACRDK4_03015 [Solirubrobacteraceae bacterium]
MFWPSIALAQSHTAASTSTQADPSSSSGPYITGGLILAGLLVALYVGLRALRRREWPDIGHIVGIVAPTTAITAGVRLGAVSISAGNLGPFESEDRVFIPLAGLALILVSARAIYDVMRDGSIERVAIGGDALAHSVRSTESTVGASRGLAGTQSESE